MWTAILVVVAACIFLELLYHATQRRVGVRTREQLYAEVHEREGDTETRCLPYIVTKVRMKQFENNSGTIEQLADWFIANSYSHSYVEHEVDYETGTYKFEPDPDGRFTVRTYDPLAMRWVRDGIALNGFELVYSAVLPSLPRHR